jgi:DNA-binding transcriptional ArsR family regulator
MICAKTKTRTEVKKSNVKILQNTEALFEKICYLTKLSLKKGDGTKIFIDISDLANCLELSERTITNHLIILRKLGMIHRTHEDRHFYELQEDVLSDLVQKKRHKFLRVYLKADHNSVDNTNFRY